jgi:hypothetical protein
MTSKPFINIAVSLMVISAIIGSPLTALAAKGTPAPAPTQLELVNTKNIPGSFTTSQSIYGTPTHIYLASAQGDLFVVKRSKTENFPLVETVNIGSPLKGVVGYSNKLFVISQDGFLREYSTTQPLTLVRSIQLSNYGLSSIAIVSNTLYVARGQGSLAVDDKYVYLAQLNQGDTAIELNSLLEVTKTFGNVFESNLTVVYNRATAARFASLNIPATTNGTSGHPAIYAADSYVFQTVPGCCGTGMTTVNNRNLASSRTLNHYYANTVFKKGTSLFVGDEAGKFALYNFGTKAITLQSSLDLPQLTGHTNPEDIEIRGLWADGTDNLVFAASSWGNDTRTADLPSLMILQLN